MRYPLQHGNLARQVRATGHTSAGRPRHAPRPLSCRAHRGSQRCRLDHGLALVLRESRCPAQTPRLVSNRGIHARSERQAPVPDLDHPPVEPEVEVADGEHLGHRRGGREEGNPGSGAIQGTPERIETAVGAVVTGPAVESRDPEVREHYREQYFRATGKLARLYYEEGRAELALPLYKEILRAEQTLEDIVRQLYRCYGQLGDLTSLIREDRHLRQALREVDAAIGGTPANGQEFEPEPETTALFREIRVGLETRPAGMADNR